jgi:hypothetical protein
MSRELTNFIIKISLVMLFFIIAGFIVFKWIAPGYYSWFYGLTAVVFYLFTIGVHAWQLTSLKKNISGFTNANMIVTFVKLLIYSAYAILYLSSKPENPIVFVLVVMVLYVTFTFIEVSNLAKFTRSQKGNQPR